MSKRIEEVVPAFLELLDLFPSDLGLDDFLNYFMGSGGLHCPQHQNCALPTSLLEPRGPDHVQPQQNEQQSRGLQPQVRGHSHPTIWTFLQAVYTLYLEQTTTDEMRLKGSCGDVPPCGMEVYDDQDLVSHMDMLRNVMPDE